jgi:sigma-B regulation protein RsbU (phosphoserine phosphatase)
VREIDLSENPRIVELTRVMGHVSGVTDPAEMLRAFSPWISTRFRRDFFVSVSRRNMPDGQFKLTRIIPGRPQIDRINASRITDPWAQWDEMPAHQGGLIGDVLAQGRPRLFTDLDLACDPVLAPVLGEGAGRFRCMAAMPSFDNGQSLNWSLSFCADPEPYGLEEFEAGMLDINMMGTATRNLVARTQVEELNSKLTAQIEQIARIQRALLPEKNPRIPGFDIATSYIPSDESGGDYYDYYRDGAGGLGVLIADVSGHGAGAATVMAMLRAIIHCYESDSGNPAVFAQYCNAKLTNAGLEGNFVTAFFCIIDPATGRIVWTRAGHNPPRIRRANGTIDTITTGATLPLGIIDDLEAESDAGRLEIGDTLILYTDGITELRDRNNELFGEERFDNAIRACSGEPEAVVDALHSAMYAFTGSMTRQDDQTMVVVRRTAAAEPAGAGG